MQYIYALLTKLLLHLRISHRKKMPYRFLAATMEKKCAVVWAYLTYLFQYSTFNNITVIYLSIKIGDRINSQMVYILLKTYS